MLNLSPSSLCDVCLEPFGRDAKAPTSVLCGHVFCLECINTLRVSNVYPYCPDVDNGAPCPLCRVRFDQRSVTRLHVDFDFSRVSNSPARIGPSTQAEVEAKRLQDTFAAVAREGITEHALRQLLEEAKSFLSGYGRDQFKDLRVLHRVISYLCETRTKLRDDKFNHEKELTRLHDEKMALENRVNDLAAKRKNEKSLAMKNEEGLRDYCKNVQSAYASMIRHYNFLADEWQKLTDDNERLRAKQFESLRASPSTPADAFTSPEGITSTLFNSYHEHESRFRGAAAVNPNSFIISPLPEFTCLPLPSTNPLPPLEDQHANPGYQPSNPEEGAHQNPVSSNSVDASSELYTVQNVHFAIPEPSQNGLSNSPSGDAPSVLATNAAPSEHRRHKSVRVRDPSDVRRSGSRSIRPSRSRASSRDRATFSSGGTRLLGGTSANPLPDVSILSAPLMIVAPQGNSSSVMSNRLQDLLQDPSAPSSSSLPSMPVYFSPTLASDFRRSRENDKRQASRSPSRTRTASAPSPRPCKQEREPALFFEGPSSLDLSCVHSKVSVPDLSNCPVSTASIVAQAAEKAKQERRRAEQEAERERRRSERAEKEKDKAEQESRRRSPPAPTASPVPVIPQASCQPAYAASVYSSHRTGSLGRSASNPFFIEKHTVKSNPIPAFGRV